MSAANTLFTIMICPKPLTSQGVPVIDLIDGLKDHGPENTLWVTPADDHPNGKANALIAQQLRECHFSDRVIQ
jgi:hypothetical protein